MRFFVLESPKHTLYPTTLQLAAYVQRPPRNALDVPGLVHLPRHPYVLAPLPKASGAEVDRESGPYKDA
jgi:hypothetical protein